MKKKNGGARPGAGRSSLKKKEHRTVTMLSKAAADQLSLYSKSLGLCQSDIVDALCLLYLDKHNKDITHCPECGKPLAFDFVMQVVSCDIECSCGHKMHIGEDIDFSGIKGVSIPSIAD